jgi:hypothetical protein
LEVDFGCVGELPNRLQHLECAQNRSRCVILVSEGVTKIDLKAIAPILRHEAVVPEYNGFTYALIRAHHIS